MPGSAPPHPAKMVKTAGQWRGNGGAMAGRNQGDTLKSFQFRNNYNPKWEAKNIKQPGGVLAPELQTKNQETKRQLGRQPLHMQSGVKAWLSLADGFVQGGQGGDHNLARRRRGTSGCWSVFESESLVCLIFIL